METKNNINERSANCEELKQDILGDGEPIDATTAGNYIGNYLRGVGDQAGTSHNFGYLFGFDNITKFVNLITSYNNGAGDDDPQVEGVRVYIGRQNPVDPGGPAPARENIMDTLFLIPVLSDGTDLPELVHLDDNTIILGDPRPCPNECLEELSFYKDLKK